MCLAILKFFLFYVWRTKSYLHEWPAYRHAMQFLDYTTMNRWLFWSLIVTFRIGFARLLDIGRRGSFSWFFLLIVSSENYKHIIEQANAIFLVCFTVDLTKENYGFVAGFDDLSVRVALKLLRASLDFTTFLKHFQKRRRMIFEEPGS